MTQLTFTEKVVSGVKTGSFNSDFQLIDSFGDFIKTVEAAMNEDQESFDPIEVLLSHCSKLTAKYPGFLDAYNHVAGVLMAREEEEAAIVWCERGLEQAYAVMPKGFDGILSWDSPGNRSFLRLHHHLMILQVSQQELDAAIRQSQQYLKFDPTDVMGVKPILADLYTVNELDEEAINLMPYDAHLPFNTPSYYYNLALIYLRQGKEYLAFTELRRGFLANQYIADFLLSGDGPEEIHDTDPYLSRIHDIQRAMIYVFGPTADTWNNEESSYAIDFLNWAYHSSVALKDRYQHVELLEKLLLEDDDGKREVIINAIYDVMNAIDETSSRAINFKIRDRSGKEYYVWENDD